MNGKKYLTFLFLLGFLSAVLFVFIAFLISKQIIVPFDHSILSYVQRFESPPMTTVMKFFTFIGSTPVVTILSLIILIFLYKVFHHRSELILFITVIAGSAILNQILKDIFHRPRPNLHRMIAVTGYSFPSGHSMEAVAFYAVLSFLLWRHLTTSFGRGLLIAFSTCIIFAIGVSRIYLGVHYPSDVIGGYLASGFWLSVTIWIYQYYMEKRDVARRKRTS